MSDSAERAMPDVAVIAPDLLALLVCPVDRQDLRLDSSTLVCTVCGRVYPIEDGIPNMLVEDEPSS